MKIIKKLNTAPKAAIVRTIKKTPNKKRLLNSSAIEENSNPTFVDDTNYRELLYFQVPEIKTNNDCVKLLEQNVVKHYKVTNHLVFIHFEDFAIKLDRKKNEFTIIQNETN